MDLLEDGGGTLDVAVFQELPKAGKGERKRPMGDRLEHVDFRPERETWSGFAVIKRLLAQAVPRQEELLPGFIPQREGEHAPESAHQVRAPSFVSMHQDLRVAATAEGMAQPEQFVSEFVVVIDLAIEDDAHPAIFVRHGLGRGRRKVDDAQAAVDESDRAGQPDRAFVRAPMDERAFHRLKGGLRGRATKINKAGDAAHNRLSETHDFGHALFARHVGLFIL
jgi:hypothetical protein